MYNGRIIKELLDKRKIPYSDLLRALGMNPQQQSLRPLMDGNPTAKRLEAIADFFGEPIDTFFKRDKSYKNHDVLAAKTEVEALRERLVCAQKLLNSQEERIKLQERLLNILSENKK